tara:strand:+ start:282 stop:662 length:381 start_codon:yes stop_codon:yes gene_type:complete
MAITVRQTKPGGYVVLNTSATDFVKLNAAATSDAANEAGASGETVNEMYIAAAKWSVSGTNTWKITRGAGTGANSTMIILAGSGEHSYQDGMRLEHNDVHPTQNVICTLSGGTGTLLLKLHKVSGE